MSRRKRTTGDSNSRDGQPERPKRARAHPQPAPADRQASTPKKPAKPRKSSKTAPSPSPPEAHAPAAEPTPPLPIEPASPAPPSPVQSALDNASTADPARALFDRPLGDDEWIPIPLEELLQRIQSMPAQPLSAHASVAWMTIPLASVLAGLAAGWQWFGFRMMVGAILDPLPGTTTMLAVIALLAAAAGPWLPLKALPRFGQWLEQRRTRKSHRQRFLSWLRAPSPPAAGDDPTRPDQPPPSWLHRVVRDHDEPLLWTSVATLASAAGGIAVLMLALATPFTSLYQYLLEHFFWTGPTLGLLEWTGVLVATAPMWLLNGLVASAIILAAARRWPMPQAGAAVLAGGTIGWAMADASHHQWTDLGLSCEQQILLGIVPMFMLAGLAVLMSQDATRAPAHREDTDTEAPETADGNERLIWLAMLVWAIGSGLALSGWTAGRDLQRLWSGPGGGTDQSAYPLLLAGGAIIGWLSVRQRVPGGPGCGMAVWSAGLGAGLAATLAAHWTDTATTLRSAILAAPAGYCLAYTQTAWLARAGRRGLAMAGLSLALLGGLAIGLAAAEWLALPLLGPVGSMAAGALVLLAFGGLVQIFARAQSGSSRHLRLGLIFAALAAALAIFPSDVRLWSHACATKPAPGTPLDPAWLVGQAPAEARRFCVIGSQRTDLLDSPGLVTFAYVFPPTAADASKGGTQQPFPNACRMLREDHALYDLIYQHGPLPAAGPRDLGYSIEWLKILARHRALGGRVVLDVPLQALNSNAQASIARTFQRAMGQPCHWCRTQMNGRPVLRLATSAGPPSTETWQAVEELLNNRRGISIHSLRRDAISRALRAE